MPPLIIAVAVAAIVVGTIAAAQSGAPLWSVFLLGPFAGIFAPKPGALNFGVSGANQGSPRYGTFGPLNNTVSNELVVPVLYGQVLVAGNLIWQSDPGNTVQQIIGLSEGQINSITGVKANNKDITGLTGCSVTPYYGTATQTADSRLPANLRPDLEFHNLAYLALTLQASDQLSGGTPTITALGQGVLVQTWVNGAWTTTKKYSNNPAACIRDFLINARYGLGLPVANIDAATFGATYDYCEEQVAGNATSDAIPGTVGLFHFDGPNGSTNFYDSFPSNPKTFIVGGTPTISTAQSKAGGSSILFNGTTDYLKTAASGDFALASNDFTFQNWFFANGFPAAGNNLGVFMMLGGGGGVPQAYIALNPDGTVIFEVSNGSTVMSISSTTAVSTGTWNHVRAIRSGSTFRLFLNGVQEGGDGTYTGSIATTPQILWIAKNADGGSIPGYFNGYIDEMQIINGSAINTTNFDPNDQVEHRYRLDYLIDSQRPAQDILNDILATFNGFLVYSGNIVKLKVEKQETITQYFGDGSTTKANASFDPGNVLKDSFTWNVITMDDRPNRIKIQWVDPSQNYVKVYTQIEDRIDQDDRNTVITKEVSLLGIIRQTQASRQAKFMMASIKYAKVNVTFAARLESIHCEIGDVVALTHQASKFSRKQFRIIDMQEGEDEVIIMTCKEYNPFIYNDGLASAIMTSTQPSGPNLFAALSDVTGLTLIEDNFKNKDGVFVTNILVSWTAISADQLLRLDRQIIQISIDGGLTYRDVAFVSSQKTAYRIALGDGQTGTNFVVRVKTVSDRGAESPGATANILMQGKRTPPSNVQDFDVNFVYDHLAFTWSAIDDEDLFAYEIRVGDANSTWETAGIVATEILVNHYNIFKFTSGAKKYFIKAIDNSANYSEVAGVDSINVTSVPEKNVYFNFDLWSRVMVLIHPLEGTLSSNLDRIPTNDFDPKAFRLTFQPKTAKTWNDYQNDGGTWNALQSSSFKFGKEIFVTAEQSWTTTAIDLGAIIAASHVIDFQSYSATNLGVVIIDISPSDDNITFTAFTSFVNGSQYSGRYFKYRFRIQATNSDTIVRLISAYLTVDVPDRNQSILNQVVGAGGSTITLTGFTTVKSIIITTVGSSNLTPRITSQASLPTSFDVVLFDTAGALQSGNANIFAQGW